MDRCTYEEYVKILEEELVPAMGCTEPIAVAYCGAVARKTLGCLPEKVEVTCSANIIKNVKSVIVPNTGGLRGISAAAAAGIVAGDENAKLEVVSKITKEQIEEIKEYLEKTPFDDRRSENEYVLDIQIKVYGNGHTAFTEIAGFHTNIIQIEKDGEVLYHQDYEEKGNSHKTDRSMLSVQQIVEFADEVDLDDVKDVLQRQIDFNSAIAEEGLHNLWGANVGKILIKSYGNSVHNRAKAYAAAGSDARMSGCELPVVINSGSGNQGITASMPVYVYAKEMNASQEMLYRALVVSNLISIHLKTGIGELSAYCGATSAGCGAGAGITYLYGGKYEEIAHTVVNAIAINSGMICDGAKPSCAAKIASAVEAGLLGMQMYMHDSQFYGGDGIVIKGVENTIKAVGDIAREGMKETDKTIIEIMIGKVME